MEQFDLYDINRNLTNKVINRTDPVPSGYYRLVVHLCIFNSKGEMLIQKRSNLKKNWPGKFDISVGGCVIKGEDSIEGIIRETSEEIGLDIKDYKLRPLFTFNFVGGFDDLYVLNLNLDLNKLVLQKEEVTEVRWASIDEILDLIKKDEFIYYEESYLRLIHDTRLSNNIYIE